jgi:hypothetical protein
MKTLLVTFVLLSFTHGIKAQDSLLVVLNKKQFKQGDTLIADCFRKSDKTSPATLNLWIENIETKRIWKFRYPLLNGTISLDLKISDSLPAGRYAVNFILQPQFFTLLGKISKYKKDTKGITMLMLSKNREDYYATVMPDEEGNFTTGKLVFEDTAKFIFYPANKKIKDLFIDISNYLDSSYVPAGAHTEIIGIGDSLPVKNISGTYVFNEKDFDTSSPMLPNITVTSPDKKEVEKFDKTVTTGLFKEDARIFDGMNDPELAQSMDLFSYLSRKVTGLQIIPYGNGFYTITRRRAPVDIFIDEFNVNLYDMPYISTADIAMIKVFEPHTGPGYSGGGTIAIYTKSGHYRPNPNRRNIFLARGFSPAYTVWQ